MNPSSNSIDGPAPIIPQRNAPTQARGPEVTGKMTTGAHTASRQTTLIQGATAKANSTGTPVLAHEPPEVTHTPHPSSRPPDLPPRTRIGKIAQGNIKPPEQQQPDNDVGPLPPPRSNSLRPAPPEKGKSLAPPLPPKPGTSQEELAPPVPTRGKSLHTSLQGGANTQTDTPIAALQDTQANERPSFPRFTKLDIRETTNSETFEQLGKISKTATSTGRIPRVEGEEGNAGKFRLNIPLMKATVVMVGDEFIHANHVGVDGKAFIASQAPLASDGALFWKLTFDNNSPILDLTNAKDDLKTKPTCYPEPGTSISFTKGNMIVTVSQKDPPIVDGGYETTTYEITIGNETKTITRTNFTDWPDHGVAKESQLRILADHLDNASAEGLPIVHCRAGLGRTGTVITASHLKQKIISGEVTPNNLEEKLSELVLELRKQRGHQFVQTEDQYALLLNYGLGLLGVIPENFVSDLNKLNLGNELFQTLGIEGVEPDITITSIKKKEDKFVVTLSGGYESLKGSPRELPETVMEVGTKELQDFVKFSTSPIGSPMNHGSIGREDAEKLVKERGDGAAILRMGSNGKPVVSVYLQDINKVVHINCEKATLDECMDDTNLTLKMKYNHPGKAKLIRP